MDFESASKHAQIWVTSSKTRFELIDSDPTTKRLSFSSNTGNESFYIVGPNHDSGAISWVNVLIKLYKDLNALFSLNTNKRALTIICDIESGGVHVWSDNDEVLSKLHHVIDSLQSCKKKSLTEILNGINKALAVTQGAAAVADAEDDEIEKDLDDDEAFSDYDEAYYEDDDDDALADTETNMPKEDDPDDTLYTRQGNPTAVKRLLKDWRNMKDIEKFGIVACPRTNNLFVWDVKLKDIPKDTRLAKDLIEYSKKHRRDAVVLLEMLFPEDYPMAPPFVRIIRPRFEMQTGHVTIGGSICMELLTRSGWRPTNDIENLLVQIRSEILSDPKAGLDKRNTDTPYDKLEAQRAFDRMVQRYGWNK